MKALRGQILQSKNQQAAISNLQMTQKIHSVRLTQIFNKQFKMTLVNGKKLKIELLEELLLIQMRLKERNTQNFKGVL